MLDFIEILSLNILKSSMLLKKVVINKVKDEINKT